MKIRVKGNSLRYRLTKSDIEHLEDQSDNYPNRSVGFDKKAVSTASVWDFLLGY